MNAFDHNPTSIAFAVRAAARLCKAKADTLDEAWLKTADPRAVQGGAICEDADAFRAQRRKLNKIALDIADIEELT